MELQQFHAFRVHRVHSFLNAEMKQDRAAVPSLAIRMMDYDYGYIDPDWPPAPEAW